MNIKLSEFVYLSSLFSADCSYVAAHAGGEDFDEVQEVAYSLSDFLSDISKKYSEVAIKRGEDISNISNVRQFIDESVWKPESEKVYDKKALIEFLDKKGHDYLEAIQDSKDGSELDTDLDIVYNYIDHEINYKNAARQISTSDSEEENVINPLPGDNNSPMAIGQEEKPEVKKDFISHSANDGEDTTGYDYAKSLNFGYSPSDVQNSVDNDNPISDEKYAKESDDNQLQKQAEESYDNIKSWAEDNKDKLDAWSKVEDKNKKDAVDKFYSDLKKQLGQD